MHRRAKIKATAEKDFWSWRHDIMASTETMWTNLIQSIKPKKVFISCLLVGFYFPFLISAAPSYGITC